MAILVDLLEDGVMTDFLEIREAYTKYKAAQDAYWSDLQKKAWAIYIGFERHLRLDQHKVTVPGEDAQPYVQVGSMDGDRFVRALALSSAERMERWNSRSACWLTNTPPPTPKRESLFRPLSEKSRAGTWWRLKVGRDLSVSP